MTPYTPRPRVYSREEIRELYRQHRLGAYRGREIEWMRLENELIRAGREGRVLNPITNFDK
jgi:hypothetical protein